MKPTNQVRTLMMVFFALIGTVGTHGAIDAQEECPEPDEIVVKLESVEDRFEVRVAGLPDDLVTSDLTDDALNAIVRVFTLKDGRRSQQPVFGEVLRRDDSLSFRPRFAFTSGVTYRVVVDVDGNEVAKNVSIPTGDHAPTTRVVALYPSGPVVPENLLKFYLQFSAPMSRGRVYDHVRIRDANGEIVELAFLEIEEELWDATHSRVTLLFDPGRIKRELRPREEIGSPLREGNRYTLEVDASWKDAEGKSLTRQFQKPFAVGEHDEQCPDPKSWKISSPSSGSRESLIIQFSEPLDRAMLEHAIVPLTEAGEAIAGDVQVEEQETRWVFTPSDRWQAGRYTIRISTRLEDRAGNSVHKPFEVDLTEEFVSPYPDEFTSLEFIVN